jgi:hypothetical protein
MHVQALLPIVQDVDVDVDVMGVAAKMMMLMGVPKS